MPPQVVQNEMGGCVMACDGELYETGTEPEFFACRIAKAEPVTTDMVRLYIASRRHNHLKLEYTLLIPLTDLAEAGRECLRIAGEAHNALMWGDRLTMQ